MGSFFIFLTIAPEGATPLRQLPRRCGPSFRQTAGSQPCPTPCGRGAAVSGQRPGSVRIEAVFGDPGLALAAHLDLELIVFQVTGNDDADLMGDDVLDVPLLAFVHGATQIPVLGVSHGFSSLALALIACFTSQL